MRPFLKPHPKLETPEQPGSRVTFIGHIALLHQLRSPCDAAGVKHVCSPVGATRGNIFVPFGNRGCLKVKFGRWFLVEGPMKDGTSMNLSITGLHHVTAIASDPQRTLDFYAGLLGLRFVKRTVNFDDPSSYHFYFRNARGTPGTILTFFSWPGARRGIRGTGQVEATAFVIPPNSVGYWLNRLKEQHVPA